MANTKSSMKKAVKDMTFEEQLEALDNSPIFKQLLEDIQQLSPDRKEAFQKTMQEMSDAE